MSKKILVIDDEPMATQLMRKRLENEGYLVDECWDGSTAVSKIRENNYDLILADYSMPSMKGDSICQEVRADERLKNVPIIIFTAFTNKDPDFFKEEGATDVIYKPVEDDDLLEKLNKYLS